jgi:hypothetical protein
VSFFLFFSINYFLLNSKLISVNYQAFTEIVKLEKYYTKVIHNFSQLNSPNLQEIQNVGGKHNSTFIAIYDLNVKIIF